MPWLDDSFWKAVGLWCASIPKAKIILEASGGSSNWPFVVLRGTIERFVLGESISFRPEEGELLSLNLRGCEVRVSENVRPNLDSALEDWATTVSFKLLCPAVREDEDDGILVFTELRKLGGVN